MKVKIIVAAALIFLIAGGILIPKIDTSRITNESVRQTIDGVTDGLNTFIDIGHQLWVKIEPNVKERLEKEASKQKE